VAVGGGGPVGVRVGVGAVGDGVGVGGTTRHSTSPLGTS
jgi:hypothetical protein